MRQGQCSIGCSAHLTLKEIPLFVPYGIGLILGSPGGSDSKESACNAGDPGSIPGLRRSAGEWNGYPLQYSCLENYMDRGAWLATVHGVPKSRLSDFHFHSVHSRATDKVTLFSIANLILISSPHSAKRG